MNLQANSHPLYLPAYIAMIFTFIKPLQVMAQMFLWMTKRKIEASKTVLSRMYMNVKTRFGKSFLICVVKRHTAVTEQNRP